MSELRDIHASLEATSKSLTRIESDLSDVCAALDVGVEVQRLASETQQQMLEALRALTNEVVEMRQAFNRWIDSEAEQKGRIRSRLTLVEEALAKR